jgi:hypothetical protein
VLAYCVAEASSLGALIYPRWEFSIEDEIEVERSSVRIRRFAIDLDVSPNQLVPEAEALVSRVVSWIERHQPPLPHLAVGA